MKIILSFFLAVLSFTAFGNNNLAAQASGNLISIQYTRPPLNQLRADDIWKFSLKNASNRDLEFSLSGTLSEKKAGLIATGQTIAIRLNKGEQKQFKVSELSQTPEINYVHADQRYKDALIRSGNLPEGEYTICISANETGTNEEIGNECIEVIREKSLESEITLVAPDNNETIDPAGGLNFSWTAVPGAKEYTLRITEITENDSHEDAVFKNKAFFEKEGIGTTSLNYTGKKFEEGKKYAWIVYTSGTKSNINIFAVNSSSGIVLRPSANCKTCEDNGYPFMSSITVGNFDFSDETDGPVDFVSSDDAMFFTYPGSFLTSLNSQFNGNKEVIRSDASTCLPGWSGLSRSGNVSDKFLIYQYSSLSPNTFYNRKIIWSQEFANNQFKRINFCFYAKKLNPDRSIHSPKLTVQIKGGGTVNIDVATFDISSTDWTPYTCMFYSYHLSPFTVSIVAEYSTIASDPNPVGVGIDDITMTECGNFKYKPCSNNLVQNYSFEDADPTVVRIPYTYGDINTGVSNWYTTMVDPEIFFSDRGFTNHPVPSQTFICGSSMAMTFTGSDLAVSGYISGNPIYSLPSFDGKVHAGFLNGFQGGGCPVSTPFYNENLIGILKCNTVPNKKYGFRIKLATGNYNDNSCASQSDSYVRIYLAKNSDFDLTDRNVRTNQFLSTAAPQVIFEGRVNNRNSWQTFGSSIIANDSYDRIVITGWEHPDNNCTRYTFVDAVELCGECSVITPECNCGHWSDNNPIIEIPELRGYYPCGSQITINKNENLTFNFQSYICNPPNCTAEYKTGIFNSSGRLIYSEYDRDLDYTFATPGVYNVRMKAICDNKECAFCNIEVVVKDTLGCECSENGWKDGVGNIEISGDLNASAVCGGNVTINSGNTINIKIPEYECKPSSCPVTYEWSIQDNSGVQIAAGSGANRDINFTYPAAGTYTVIMNPICNGVNCITCTVRVNVQDNAQTCTCVGWNPGKVSVTQDTVTTTTSCGPIPVNVHTGSLVTFTFPGFQCNPTGCQTQYAFREPGNPNNILTPLGPNPVYTFNFTRPGLTSLTIFAFCGQNQCTDSCTIVINVLLAENNHFENKLYGFWDMYSLYKHWLSFNDEKIINKKRVLLIERNMNTLWQGCQRVFKL